MSLQVWCYDCDEYVEGWEVLDRLKEEFEEDLEFESKENIFKSRNSGAGKRRKMEQVS